MVPAAVVDKTIEQLAGRLEPGDILIDGGNSYYHDDIRRAAALKPRKIHYVDVGTSGGVWGLERGYCLMIGGEDGRGAASGPGLRRAGARRGVGAPHAGTGKSWRHRRARIRPLRPERRWSLRQDGSQRDRVRTDGRVRRGLQHPQARRRRQRHTQDVDAETTPLRNPELYQYDLNLADIAEVWRRGSVIASWLLDLTAQALVRSPELAEFSGRVSDSGEGRWTVERRDRRGGARSGAQCGLVRTVQLARHR